MTTNREWLYSLDVADLADWFDAEHIDGLDGDTDALERECAELQAQVYELTAERDELKADLEAERGIWKGNCEDWKKHAMAAENACYEARNERERYREKFGKCLDYADAIHALMDDEGMA